ncbi:hypothetical protein GGX14DRAFT_637960 [Mycena pura]|uniref:Uncharacterized protein n=1 Tax=Mycena pura TaxID=153505 RepID=A0AAD6YNU2_9AGAR|nr:hypothetical protein GGX14DRAFT_637960 [Mycena pura]
MADADSRPPRIIHAPEARAHTGSSNADDNVPTHKTLHTSPVRRSSPLAQNGSATSNGRRRVHSVNPAPYLPSYPRSRRTMSFGPSQASQREGASSPVEDSGISLFSDEYDLYPRILQDVQRALKLKARREARLKASNSGPLAVKSEHAPGSLQSRTSPLRQSFPVPFPPPPVPVIPERPIPSLQDGPSGHSFANHPVPTSSDEGTTLDWSGIGFDDDKSERRWTMSISKRRDKEKHPSNSAVETRESMYAAKILQIRTKVSPRALERASVARDQLGRRYNLIYNSLPSGGFNISKVARWFANQDEVVKSSLEQAEELTWLRASQKSRKPQSRFPWHLSALIMEEYIHHLRGNYKPQDNLRIASLNSSPSLSISSPQQNPSPRGSSYTSLRPSLSRKLSYDGHLTFEPIGEPGRLSVDRESRKSGESGYSSILSASSLPQVIVSPTSTHFRRRGDSEHGSPRNSISEHSDEGGRKKRPTPAPLSRDLLSGTTTKAGAWSGTQDLKPVLTPIPDDRKHVDRGPENTTQVHEQMGPPSSVDKVSIDIPPTVTARSFGQRKVRVSLPFEEDFRVQMEQKRQQEADEQQANREYELKQHLLDATIAQNNRVRQLLNHIAAGVREYDQAQASLSTSLNLPYKELPRELVEAFSHDPAAVTGATRKYQSWRAVDDIHHRLARQREIFREFLSSAPNHDAPVVSESAFADPILALTETLKTLEAERQEIAWRAVEVSDVLKTVQSVHGSVKTAYNGMLSHTSVIYPEISTIVALEESYKDQYQYFWDVAMDVLTFILDTVAPFWRTHGKTIGDDIQHFLIIPLYRNEFTGEAKRYPISEIPRRSLRHWIGLFLFFLASGAITVFQAQAAVSSVSHLWLLTIPYPYLRRLLLIPFWISIIIQWWAVVAELAIVLTQMAVVMWWAGWYVNIFT